MTETWRPIPGYEGRYIVSDLGAIKSLRFPRGRRKVPKDIALFPGRKKYLYANLWRENQIKMFFVHKLVLLAFVGPRPVGYECSHKNGKRDDNRLCNLEWLTHKENIAQKRAHGTVLFGENHPMAKLSDEEVRAIRALPPEITYHEIAKMYGISYSNVCSIRRGASRIMEVG